MEQQFYLGFTRIKEIENSDDKKAPSLADYDKGDYL